MSDIYTEKPWLKNYDRNVPPSLEYEEKTFAEKFREAVEKYPDKTALIYMGKQITFTDLDLLSNQFAHYLIKIGLKPDDVVGLHMPNIPAHYIAIIGVQKAGCVSTGLSPLLTSHEMEHQINDSGAKVIITVDVLFAKIAEVADKVGCSTVIVTEIADFLPGVKKGSRKTPQEDTYCGSNAACGQNPDPFHGRYQGNADGSGRDEADNQ